MSSVSQITVFFTMFLNQLPILLVCLAALGLVLTRWHQKSPALPWALMGFGLALLLCLAIPVSQLIIQNWLMSSGGDMAHRASISSVISIFWSVLRAVSYGLLAIAIFVGQSQRKSGSASNRS
jgi:hypothetical protein